MIYDDKTELILIGTRQQLGSIDNVCNISVGEYDIYPSSCNGNLGAWFDNKWSMQVINICKAVFYLPLGNNPKQIRALIGLKPCFHNSIETQNLYELLT